MSYVCQDSGVAKSDECSSRDYGVAKSNRETSDVGPVKKTMNNEALVGRHTPQGRFLGFVGRTTGRLEAIQGKVLEISIC